MEKRGIFKAKKEILFSEKSSKTKKKNIYKLQVQEYKGDITLETKCSKRIMRD